MKPTLLTLGLSTALFGAPILAPAQTKSVQYQLLGAPAQAYEYQPPQHPSWGTIPPHKPLPYGYVWNDYRGAEIEHPLYAPRHADHAHRSSGPGGIVSQFCCWIDKLFTRNCAATSTTVCEGHVSTDLPPLPALSPLSPHLLPSPPPENLPVELTPIRPLAPPAWAAPVPQQTQPQSPSPPQVHATPSEPRLSDPAPFMPPVDLIPTRPLVSQPPADPPPADLGPAEITPVTPPVEQPRPLAEGAPAVIELAPDFVVPGEPATAAPPQNVIPPRLLVPGNVIPQRTVPLNSIPGRR